MSTEVGPRAFGEIDIPRVDKGAQGVKAYKGGTVKAMLAGLFQQTMKVTITHKDGSAEVHIVNKDSLEKFFQRNLDPKMKLKGLKPEAIAASLKEVKTLHNKSPVYQQIKGVTIKVEFGKDIYAPRDRAFSLLKKIENALGIKFDPEQM